MKIITASDVQQHALRHKVPSRAADDTICAVATAQILDTLRARVRHTLQQIANDTKGGRLQPLTQWICDCCGGVILSPQEAWLEWHEDSERRYFEFRILHHATASPLRTIGADCYTDDARSGLHLREFLGVDGMLVLCKWLYRGEVRDIAEWVVLFRRCHIAGYEQARRRFSCPNDYRCLLNAARKIGTD